MQVAKPSHSPQVEDQPTACAFAAVILIGAGVAAWGGLGMLAMRYLTGFGAGLIH
jgi:hypothetical protein